MTDYAMNRTRRSYPERLKGIRARVTQYIRKTSDEQGVNRIWCRGEDSNLHGLLHWYLKPARLPIPPPRLAGTIAEFRTQGQWRPGPNHGQRESM